jgi:hypothetical protein
MSAAAIPVACLIPLAVRRPSMFEFATMTCLIWLGCALLCAFTLRAVIWLRTSEVENTRFQVVTVGFIHVGTGFIGIYFAHVAGTAIGNFIRML